MRVAVVAAACEYSESASPAQLWQTVLHGRRCFREIPPSRLRLADYGGDGPDSIYPIEAALLENYHFDRARFSIPLSLYERTDLSHWLALDVASRALDSLQIAKATELADRTAVIVANTLTGEFSRASLMRYRWPYVERVLRRVGGEADTRLTQRLNDIRADYCAPFPPPDEDSLAGSLANTIAGRVANFHGLRGGAFIVDGACASSLVAIVSACEKLAMGDIDCVVVGAVDLSLDPFELVGFARNGALARDLMRIFDEHSAGFWPGEGCGFVVLASEETVRRRGWPVLGWVCGAAMSTDGIGSLTLPTADGQLLASRRAWSRAELEPDHADYFEAHGTGTAVGDPIELQGLAQLVEGGNSLPISVGSIKAQIGHTKAAAGMAGLLKALAICRERVIPATVGCEQEHPALGSLGSRVAVAKDVRPIDHDRAITVGINSFGFGGVNCHVVLQGFPAPPPGTSTRPLLPRMEREGLRDQLFLLQAPTREMLASLLLALKSRAQTLSRAQVADLAAGMGSALERDQAAGAAPGYWRACVIAATPLALREACASTRESLLGAGKSSNGTGECFEWAAPAEQEPRVAVVFPGQGLAHSIRPLDWCARFPFLSDGASRVSAMAKCDPNDTSQLQPFLAEAAIAGTELLDALGINTDMVLGHSFGELSALHAAGVLDLMQFRQLARDRGTCMHDHGQPGAMVALIADAATAARLAHAFDLDIACVNGANSHVLAGDTAQVQALLRECALRGTATHLLPTTLPFHSRGMAQAALAFRRRLSRPLSMTTVRRQIISTLTGELLSTGTDLVQHLCDQFTRPVRFAQAMSLARQCDLVIDAGIGDSLSGLIDQAAADKSRQLSLFGHTLQPVLRAAGAYWVLGGALNIAALFASPGQRQCGLSDTPRFLSNPCGVTEGAETAPALSTASAETVLQHPDDANTDAIAAKGDAAATLRAVLAEVTGLARESIRGQARLLSDLHLNSIKARHAIALAARRLGVSQVPFDLALLARATVDDTVAWLDGLRLEESAGAGVPEALEPWMRVMSHDWVDVDPPSALADRPRTVPTITLRSGTPESVAASLLQAAHQCAATPGEGLLVLQDAQLANGFLRSMAHEYPDRRFSAVEFEQLGEDTMDLAYALHAGAGRGYSEIRMRGRRVQSRVLAPSHEGDPARGWRPTPTDVAVFAGGAKGIGTHAALGIAASFGCKVAVIGRSSQEAPEVAQFMSSLRKSRSNAIYVQANLESREQAAHAIREIETRLGAVTALFHLAGRNEPKVIAQLVAEDIAAAVRAKVLTLDHLLTNLHFDQLKALVSFGSIIGELGFAGEAHYALANEWLHQRLHEVALKAPNCLVLPLSWSAWSAGMAAQLSGVLQSLTRSGVRPLQADEGLAALLDLLRSPPPHQNLVPTGRFGAQPGTAWHRDRLQHWRFLEQPRVFYDGIELITDAAISTDTDKYLQDHAPGGLPLLPFVVATEAMASAAACVLNRVDLPTTIEELTAHEPISIAPGQRVILRTMALVLVNGRVRTEVRCDLTGFTVCHFSARFAFDTPSADRRQLAVLQPMDPSVGGDDVLYRGLCFHGPRFQRIERIAQPRALTCFARTRRADTTAWFSTLVPPHFLLGDAGVRDAALHMLQTCVPHDTVLPVKVSLMRPGKLRSDIEYHVSARQVAQDGKAYRFDFEISDAAGVVVEEWRGVLLQKSAPSMSSPLALPVAVIPAMLERLCADALGDRGVLAGVSAMGRVPLASEEALRHAVGRVVTIRRDDRGPGCEPIWASSAHTEIFTVAVARDTGPVAIDAQFDPGYAPEVWQTMLQPQRSAFAAGLTRDCGLAPGDGFAVAWCVSECLSKLGRRDWPNGTARTQLLQAAHTATLVHVQWDGLQAVAGAVRVTNAQKLLWFALALQDNLEQQGPTHSQELASDAQPVDAK